VNLVWSLGEGITRERPAEPSPEIAALAAAPEVDVAGRLLE
jgi:hypothetical protein